MCHYPRQSRRHHRRHLIYEDLHECCPLSLSRLNIILPDCDLAIESIQIIYKKNKKTRDFLQPKHIKAKIRSASICM